MDILNETSTDTFIELEIKKINEMNKFNILKIKKVNNVMEILGKIEDNLNKRIEYCSNNIKQITEQMTETTNIFSEICHILVKS